MPKSKNRSSKKIEIKSQIPEKSDHKNFIKKSWLIIRSPLKVIINIFITLIGLFSIISLFPSINIESNNIYTPIDPNPIFFTITNSSLYPIRNIQPSMGVCFITYGDQPMKKNCKQEFPKLYFPFFFIQNLDKNEKYQIALEDMMVMEGSSRQPAQADITIAISYTIWGLPWWPLNKEFRFTTRKLSDGNIYWFPRPLMN